MYSKALEKGNLLHFWEDGLRERTFFFCPCSQPLQDGRKVLSVMPALGGGVHFTKGYLLHCEKLSFIRKCFYCEQPIKRLFWFNLFFLTQ